MKITPTEEKLYQIKESLNLKYLLTLGTKNTQEHRKTQEKLL